MGLAAARRPWFRREDEMVAKVCRLVLSMAGPHWPILTVALLEVVMFSHCCRDWWKHNRGPDRPATLRGEGMIIGDDGLAYYAWLRSLMIDGDWSFANEFDEHNVFHNGVPGPDAKTPLGLRANHYPIGLACVWAPAVVLTHEVVSLPFANHFWSADGYTLPYQLAVGVTTLGVSLLGLGFLYAICLRYTDPKRAALAAGSITLGTTIVYYSSIETSMAHGIGTAVVAALIWYWLSTYGSLSRWRWIVVGALVGLATLIRSQLGTFAILPAAEAGLIAWRALREGRRQPAELVLDGILLAAAAAFLVFTPQLVSWRLVYGKWWAMPHRLAHHWLTPAFSEVFISRDRSLFFWTPIVMVLCTATLYYCVRRARQVGTDGTDDRPAPRRGPIVLLAIAFALQAYFVGSVWGSGVYLGASYGFRLLTEALVALAPGLALLLSEASRARARLITIGCCLLVVWNLLLIRQYQRALIPHEAGASLSVLLSNVPKVVRGL
jgi:hypothetical protein